MPALIDGSAPTREEVIARNMKIAKANMASELARFMVGNNGFLVNGQPIMDSNAVANYCIGLAEGIIEKYSMMPDAEGNRGLVS